MIQYFKKYSDTGVSHYRIQNDNYTCVFRGNDASKIITHEVFERPDMNNMIESTEETFKYQFKLVIEGMFIDGIKVA